MDNCSLGFGVLTVNQTVLSQDPMICAGLIERRAAVLDRVNGSLLGFNAVPGIAIPGVALRCTPRYFLSFMPDSFHANKTEVTTKTKA